MAKKNYANWFIGFMLLAIVVTGGLIVGGVIKLPSTTTVIQTQIPAGTDVATGKTCTGGASQSFVVYGVNQQTGDQISGGQGGEFAYRVVGEKAWSAGNFGTAITGLQPGISLEVVPGVTASVETNKVYGQKVVFDNIDCVQREEIEVKNNTLYTDMTATFYNADGTAAYQALTTDKDFRVCVKWSAAVNEFAGNPYLVSDSSLSDNGYARRQNPNIVCVNLNSTSFDMPTKVDVNGVDMNPVSTPSSIHAASTGYTPYCYEAPVFDENEVKWCITVNTDATYTNAVDQTAFLYTGSYYINSVDKTVQWGVQTDDGNFVSFTAAEQATLDFSA